jgi:YbgC/YbaW family acyl-CoA thioester hydrolase
VAPPDVDLTVYPDECDSFGHLNQASFLSLFERARWEMMARGPGMDFFTRAGAWPAVRKAEVEYHTPAFPGDIIRFQTTLLHLGHTSFTLRQTARRVQGDVLLATAEFVFVCVDRDGRSLAIPVGFEQFMNQRSPGGTLRRLTVNGVSLGVEIKGTGPAILFIHGYPLDHSIWQDQVAALDDWMRIVPDLRGMGQSDAPDLGYSMATYAEDLLALMDALGCKEAVLCGLSMGGYIVFELLRRARARVRGLILIDTRAEAESPEGKRARDVAMAQAREGGAEAIAGAMLPKMLARSTAQENPALAERVHAMMAATEVAGILGALGAMRDRPDSTSLLKELGGIPTLVVVGEEDQVTPPDAAKTIADSIPGARLAVVSGAGHLTPLERASETTALVVEFLRGLRPEGSAAGQ